MDAIHSLSSLEELEQWLDRSRRAPVWIFKHSLFCGTSRSALREFERFVESRPDDEPASFTLVAVQDARAVSDEIARRTGVRHETPQALLVDRGRVVWHASHWRIREQALRRAATAAVAPDPEAAGLG